MSLVGREAKGIIVCDNLDVKESIVVDAEVSKKGDMSVCIIFECYLENNNNSKRDVQ